MSVCWTFSLSLFYPTLPSVLGFRNGNSGVPGDAWLWIPCPGKMATEGGVKEKDRYLLSTYLIPQACAHASNTHTSIIPLNNLRFFYCSLENMGVSELPKVTEFLRDRANIQTKVLESKHNLVPKARNLLELASGSETILPNQSS